MTEPQPPSSLAADPVRLQALIVGVVALVAVITAHVVAMAGGAA